LAELHSRLFFSCFLDTENRRRVNHTIRNYVGTPPSVGHSLIFPWVLYKTQLGVDLIGMERYIRVLERKACSCSSTKLTNDQRIRKRGSAQVKPCMDIHASTPCCCFDLHELISCEGVCSKWVVR
jgi:hypothetical protein